MLVVQALLVALVMFFTKFCDHGWGQPLVERPIVSSMLVGIVLGHPVEGIILGAYLELLFIGTITIGNALPADVTVGAVLATAFTILLGKDRTVAITLAVPISLLAVYVYLLFKLFCTSMVERFDALLDKGNDQGALRIHFILTLCYGAIFAVIAFFAVLLGTNAIQWLVNAVPKNVMDALKVVGNILPVLGFAILLKGMWQTSIAGFFFMGFVAAAYLKLPILAIAVIGAAAAVYICYSDFENIQRVKGLKKEAAVSGAGESEDFFNE